MLHRFPIKALIVLLFVVAIGRVDWLLSSLGRGLCSLLPPVSSGGVTRLQPYSIELPTPLRTGRALLTHPAPSYHLSQDLRILPRQRCNAIKSVSLCGNAKGCCFTKSRKFDHECVWPLWLRRRIHRKLKRSTKRWYFISWGQLSLIP